LVFDEASIKASYVVQQLRRPYSLAIKPQAYIFLPIPFAKNGGGRLLNLYALTKRERGEKKERREKRGGGVGGGHLKHKFPKR